MDKVTNQLSVEVPQNGFVDEGEGVVSFPNGLTITDGTVQRNGTRYDINSLDLSRYGGQLTGDHKDELGNLIGETIGTVKKDGKVIVNKIRYAVKENPYARLAYNLLVGGFSKNFSTETIGPSPDHEGIYWNAELVGLSQVVTQNNYNAHINKVVHNSLEQSKQDGLDVSGIEEKVLNQAPEKDKNMEDTNTETETKEIKETPETETQTVTEAPAEKPEAAEQKEAPVENKADDADDSEKIVETPHLPERDEAENDKAENQIETSKEELNADENGVYVEKTTTVTTHESEYIESEEEKAERKEREARWAEEDKARIEAEKTPDVVVVVQDADNAAPSDEVQKETNNKEEKMEDKKVENSTVTMSKEDLAELFQNALAPITADIAAVKEQAQNAFDASAKEPEFKKEENAADEPAKNAYAAMDFQERYQHQVDAAWNAVKVGNVEAWAKLREINAVNLEELKKAKIATNAMTLEDLGNFVIAPEMYNEIAGQRTDYSAIIDATEWRETMSMEFAWLQRTGDIDMRNVGFHATDEDADANLKPISEYSATPRKSALEELAAVTVVATSATRFAAVDLLADAAAGYRTDYDRKRAQLVIARLEQAVDSTGFSTEYAPVEDVDALTAWIDAITSISDTTLNGTLVFNARTFAELKSRALRAGANGPLSEILTTGSLPTVFGYRFVVVPNDLMPSLGGSETIAHEVDGVSVTINHAVYFADLTTFTGRTSGGLQYDVSNSASYEVGGATRSAYQRNELVLRGSFFRGGAVKDARVVAGVRAGTVS